MKKAKITKKESEKGSHRGDQVRGCHSGVLLSGMADSVCAWTAVLKKHGIHGGIGFRFFLSLSVHFFIHFFHKET